MITYQRNWWAIENQESFEIHFFLLLQRTTCNWRMIALLASVKVTPESLSRLEQFRQFAFTVISHPHSKLSSITTLGTHPWRNYFRVLHFITEQHLKYSNKHNKIISSEIWFLLTVTSTVDWFSSRSWFLHHVSSPPPASAPELSSPPSDKWSSGQTPPSPAQPSPPQAWRCSSPYQSYLALLEELFLYQMQYLIHTRSEFIKVHYYQ